MIAILDQIHQEVEHLGLERNGVGPAAKLPPIRIKPMIGKQEFHLVVTPVLRLRPAQEIIKPFSRANQAAGKVFLSQRRHSAPP